MKRVVFVLLIFVELLGCDSNNPKEEIEANTPDCINQKISDIENEPVWNPPSKIYSYQYKGELVYFISSRCCDISSTLYDQNCKAICSPDGGITGSGDGLCPDFFDDRTNEKLIWEDSRE